MITKVKTEAAAAVKKHGSIRKAASAMGIPFTTFSARLQGVAPRPPRKMSGTLLPVSPVMKDREGRSLAEFRAEHDKDFIVPKRIKEGLKALGSGWAYEVQFAKAAAISLSDLNAYRSLFEPHVVVVNRAGKRAWAGTKEVAAKMRAMVS